MLDGGPRSANVAALTPCEVVVLERRHVIPLLEGNPAVCLKLMELLCARIRRSDERMADKTRNRVFHRFAKLRIGNFRIAGLMLTAALPPEM